MLVEIRDTVDSNTITREDITLLGNLVVRLYDNRMRDLRPWEEYTTKRSRFYALDFDGETNTVCFGVDPDQLSDKAAEMLKKVNSIESHGSDGRVTFSKVRFDKKDQYIILIEDIT